RRHGGDPRRPHPRRRGHRADRRVRARQDAGGHGGGGRPHDPRSPDAVGGGHGSGPRRDGAGHPPLSDSERVSNRALRPFRLPPSRGGWGRGAGGEAGGYPPPRNESSPPAPPSPPVGGGGGLEGEAGGYPPPRNESSPPAPPSPPGGWGRGAGG